MRDAFQHGEPGAKELIHLAISVRCNKRTRRTLTTMQAEYHRTVHARWYRQYCVRIFALWKVLRKLAMPNDPVTGPAPRMSARSQRDLVQFGIVKRNRTTLKEAATAASKSIMDAARGAQLVMWMDNLYFQRYGTDPSDAVLSQNVSAMAVLNLDELTGLHVATRRVRFPDYDGHPDILDMVQRVDQVVTQLRQADAEMQNRLFRLNMQAIRRKDIRVPFDIQRLGRQRMVWKPWNLAEQQVGNNQDLLMLLLDVVDVQQFTGRVLPLLVDENIHYRVLRLLYSNSLIKWNVAQVLKQVPLIYGIWHAYKHTLVVVFRAFFPVLAQLECTGEPVQGNRVSCKRRILYLEKLFAILLLMRDNVDDTLQEQLRVVTAAISRNHVSNAQSTSPTDPASATALMQKKKMLEALSQVLNLWAPALFRLGFMVRQCTWEGYPGGQVTGRTAHQVLCECLLLQTHVQQDWDAKLEYTRTIALALMTWQPWMMERPGCIFVEESGEAMLSRFMSSVRLNNQLRGFEAAWRLFISLPSPGRHAIATRGSVKKSLIHLFTSRVRSLILRREPFLFPEVPLVGAGNGVWRAQIPDSFDFPDVYPAVPASDLVKRVLQSAIAVLSTGAVPDRGLRDWLGQHIPQVSIPVETARERGHRRATQWATDRAERMRIARVILSQGGAARAQPARVAKPRPISPPHAAASQPVPPAAQQRPPSPVPSVGSLYEPPSDWENPLSEGYISPADTDGLGSVGDLDLDEPMLDD